MQDADQIVAMRETFIGMEHRLSAALEQRQLEATEKLREELKQMFERCAAEQPQKIRQSNLQIILLNGILPLLIWAVVIYMIMQPTMEK